ncbi:MAG: FAD-dependent oxidoreductase [Phycisphaerales bacterium]|nr:FAD-dependent oxidoreductase [Phycisphaerales bacterium]
MRHDVLVIGGGPVGLTSALLLAQQGLRVAVIEKQHTSRPSLGAVALDDECLRIWQACGLEHDLDEDWEGGDIGAVMCEYLDGRGRPFIQLKQQESDLGYPQAVVIHLERIIEKLRRCVEDHESIELFSGYTMVDLKQCEQSVTIDCVGHNERMISIRGAWAIACDGRTSATREILGIQVESKALKNPWLVVDFDDENQSGHAQFWCLPKKAIVTVPMPHGTRRIERMLPPNTDDSTILEDESLVRQLVSPAWDGALKAPIRAKAIMCFQSGIAQRWRSGRVFLAGDAAHQTPPFAGQGLATGLRDAANLSFKIAGVHQQWLSADVLDTYEIERRPHQERMIDLALRLGKIMAPGSRVRAMGLHSTIRALMTIPPIRRHMQLRGAGTRPTIYDGFLSSGGMAGQYMPQPWVNTELSNRVRLDQLLGRRMTWIAIGDGDSPAELDRSFLSHCDTMLVENQDFYDSDRLLQRRFGAGSLVLVRPDRVIHTHYPASKASSLRTRNTPCLTTPSHHSQAPVSGAALV